MGIRSEGSNEAYRAWKVEAAEVDIAAGTVERGAAGRVGGREDGVRGAGRL